MYTVLITHSARPEIEQSLLANEKVFSEIGAEIIVATYDMADSVAKRLGESNPNLLIIKAEHGPFSKSAALNAAFCFSTRNRLLLLDCDIALHPELHRELDLIDYQTEYAVLDGLRETKHGYSSPYLVSRESTFYLECLDGRKAEVRRSYVNYRSQEFQGTGLICLSSAAYLGIGGMTEDLVGWGWEDIDFQVRLQIAGLAPNYVSPSGWHTTHSDELRDLPNYDKITSDRRNSITAIKRYERGCFTGSLSPASSYGWRCLV